MPKKKQHRLSAGEQKFIEEYTQGTRLSTALSRAGIESTNAISTLAKLKRNPAFAKAFETQQQNVDAEKQLTGERVLEELAAIGFADIADYYDEQGNMRPLDEIPPRARRAIVGLKIRSLGTGENQREVMEYELADKLTALDKLGKNQKLFNDREPQTLDITITQRSDDELVNRLIELTRKAGIVADQRRVGASASDATFVDVLPR